MTPEFAAAAAARPIAELEEAWTTDSRVLWRARALELPAWAFYLAGRAGVLGDDVHPETLGAALGMVAPDALRAGWDAAARLGPTTIAAARLAECAGWGADHLAGVADARLTDLLGRVVTDADATAMPIFAGTRTMVGATPHDHSHGARAALLVHALAEHRAAAMLVACRAVGLRPVEALIAQPDGEQEALTLGWSPPFPARLAVLRRYATAGALADRIAADAFSTLPPSERTELVDRLVAAAAAVRDAGR